MSQRAAAARLAALFFALLCPMALAEDLKSPTSSTSSTVVAAACTPRNGGCGAGTNAAPCCPNLWCHNGACKPYQQAQEPCGTPATPPCQPGLACVQGKCQAAK